MSLAPRIDDLEVYQNRNELNGIINGSFDFWQRGTTFSTPNFAYTADRWRWFVNGGYGYTVNRSSDVPTLAQSGFASAYSIEVDNTTALTPSVGNEYMALSYSMTGTDFSHFKGKTCVFSFWFKSVGLAGTYSVAFRSPSNASYYVSDFTVALNTWTKVAIPVIFDDTIGTYPTSDTEAMNISICLSCGNSLKAPTANVWASGIMFGTSNQSDGLGNVSYDYRIAQAMLKVVSPDAFALGNYDTTFKRAGGTYRQEFDECLRYCAKLELVGGNGTSNLGPWMYANSSRLVYHAPSPGCFRTAPVLSLDPSTTWALLKSDGTDVTTVHYATLTLSAVYTTNNVLILRITGSGSPGTNFPSNTYYHIRFTGTSNIIYLSAEL